MQPQPYGHPQEQQGVACPPPDQQTQQQPGQYGQQAQPVYVQPQQQQPGMYQQQQPGVYGQQPVYQPQPAMYPQQQPPQGQQPMYGQQPQYGMPAQPLQSGYANVAPAQGQPAPGAPPMAPMPAPQKPAEVEQTPTGFKMSRSRRPAYRWTLRILTALILIGLIVLAIVVSPWMLLIGLILLPFPIIYGLSVYAHHVDFNINDKTIHVIEENLYGVKCCYYVDLKVDLSAITGVIARQVYSSNNNGDGGGGVGGGDGGFGCGSSASYSHTTVALVTNTGEVDIMSTETGNNGNDDTMEYAENHKQYWGYILNAEGGGGNVKIMNTVAKAS